MPAIDAWLPLASVLGIYVARLAEVRTRRQTVAGPVKETLTLRLFILCGTAMTFGGITEYLLRHQRLHWLTFVAGWICGLASFAIRRQAIATLGKFWSLHVEIRDQHEMVHGGPFRWVRHPTYFSMVLELLSAALILNAFGTLLAVTVMFVPALIYRVRIEEQALVEKFGDAYRAYQQTTPALFPYKWPSTK